MPQTCLTEACVFVRSLRHLHTRVKSGAAVGPVRPQDNKLLLGANVGQKSRAGSQLVPARTLPLPPIFWPRLGEERQVVANCLGVWGRLC